MRGSRRRALALRDSCQVVKTIWSPSILIQMGVQCGRPSARVTAPMAGLGLSIMKFIHSSRVIFMVYAPAGISPHSFCYYWQRRDVCHLGALSLSLSIHLEGPEVLPREG